MKNKPQLIKNMFLIGIRRSGTSICRQLLIQHPCIQKLEFEPHDLIYVMSTMHLQRYKNSLYHINTIDRFKKNVDKYYGAKIVINPALGFKRWIWLNKFFPNAKYIFIIRDKENTYKSYVKTDAKVIAGVSPKFIYDYWYDETIKSFQEFCYRKPEKSIIFTFENLVLDADKTLAPVWNFLNIPKLEGLNSQMVKPMHWDEK